MRKGVVGSVSAYSWPPSTSLLWDSAGGRVVTSWFPLPFSHTPRLVERDWAGGCCEKIGGGPT